MNHFFFVFLTEERPSYTADGLPARILEESSGVFIVQEYASIPKVTWKAVCILFILSVKCVQRETEVSTFLFYYFLFLKIVTSLFEPKLMMTYPSKQNALRQAHFQKLLLFGEPRSCSRSFSLPTPPLLSLRRCVRVSAAARAHVAGRTTTDSSCHFSPEGPGTLLRASCGLLPRCQTGKPRIRGITKVAQSHVATQWQSWGSSQASWFQSPRF